MAEKLDVFNKTFDNIKKRSDKAAEEVERSEKLIAQTAGIVREGVKEIGLRVQELKDVGETGTSIRDFMSDKQVKSMYDSCVNYLRTIEADIKKMVTLKRGTIKPIIDDYAQLKRDMQLEVAARKKAMSTKVGGNKSLPEMEKLLAVVDKWEEQRNSLVKIMYFEPEDAAQHKKQFEDQLASQVASSKDAKLSDLQRTMQEQLLDGRVLIGRVNRAKTLMESVLAECATAAAALEARDNKALMAAKANIMAPMKELRDLAQNYKDALSDQWIKGLLNASKDKDKLTRGANGVVAMYAKASEELKKVANARIQ